MGSLITVVTGWSPSGWRSYAQNFAKTFTKFWPQDVRVISFVEEQRECPRIELHMLEGIEAFVQFRDRWGKTPMAMGRKPEPYWKSKERVEGYSWRWDALKFCRQAFIPYTALSLIDSEYLLWLDADVMTHAPVPIDKIVGLLPSGKDVAYLGRGEKHSEIGFQLYRKTDATHRMLRMFFDLYATDEIFTLPEWHSAYAFDYSREKTQIPAHDMTPGGYGHVWFQSPLKQWMDHLKGDRKRLGRSTERTQ